MVASGPIPIVREVKSCGGEVRSAVRTLKAIYPGMYQALNESTIRYWYGDRPLRPGNWRHPNLPVLKVKATKWLRGGCRLLRPMVGRKAVFCEVK